MSGTATPSPGRGHVTAPPKGTRYPLHSVKESENTRRGDQTPVETSSARREIEVLYSAVTLWAGTLGSGASGGDPGPTRLHSHPTPSRPPRSRPGHPLRPSRESHPPPATSCPSAASQNSFNRRKAFRWRVLLKYSLETASFDLCTIPNKRRACSGCGAVFCRGDGGGPRGQERREQTRGKKEGEGGSRAEGGACDPVLTGGRSGRGRRGQAAPWGALPCSPPYGTRGGDVPSPCLWFSPQAFSSNFV